MNNEEKIISLYINDRRVNNQLQSTTSKLRQKIVK